MTRLIQASVAVALLAACGPDVDQAHLDTPTAEEPSLDSGVPLVETPRAMLPERIWDNAAQPDTDLPSEPAVDTGVVRVPNTPPHCGIVAPVEGEVFDAGTSIRFRAEASDDEDRDLRLIWSSDPYGAMVLGNDFGFILPPGQHVVWLEVADRDGETCVDDVFIEVLQP